MPLTAHNIIVNTRRRKLLVCGNGYLGQALADRAREQGYQVSTCSLSGSHGSHTCDLGDAASVASLASFLEAPDLIVHCASSGKGGAPAYEHVYRNGIQNLHATFPEAILLFTSSSSVYGQTDGGVVTEESAAEPDRETGRILLQSEQSTIDAGGVVCRLSGIYGPARSVILKKFLTGDAVIEEDGRRYLNQIHRDDAVNALLHLMSLMNDEPLSAAVRGQIFNVSDSRPLSQKQTYMGLAELLHCPLPPTGPRDENRKRGWTHKRVSNQKLCQLGWQPQFPSFLDAVPSIVPTLQLPDTA